MGTMPQAFPVEKRATHDLLVVPTTSCSEHRGTTKFDPLCARYLEGFLWASSGLALAVSPCVCVCVWLVGWLCFLSGLLPSLAVPLSLARVGHGGVWVLPRSRRASVWAHWCSGLAGEARDANGDGVAGKTMQTIVSLSNTRPDS
jgi:hypothetical protein